MAKKSSTFTCVIQAAKDKRTETAMREHSESTVHVFEDQRLSLQHSIHDVQLPIAAGCQTKVVSDNKESFVPIACEI